MNLRQFARLSLVLAVLAGPAAPLMAEQAPAGAHARKVRVTGVVRDDSNIDALARAVLDALSRRDLERLRALPLSEAEFRDAFYRGDDAVAVVRGAARKRNPCRRRNGARARTAAVWVGAGQGWPLQIVLVCR